MTTTITWDHPDPDRRSASSDRRAVAADLTAPGSPTTVMLASSWTSATAGLGVLLAGFLQRRAAARDLP